jgi:predicted nucleic acid-binding protein
LAVKFKTSETHADAVIASLKKAKRVNPDAMLDEVCSDANDLPVMGTALAAQADGLVTGDRELQALGSYQQMPIPSPRVFYDRLQ